MDSQYKSHFCCWEQKQPPACGLKGEHIRCCLCEHEAPQSKSVEGENYAWKSDGKCDLGVHNPSWCGDCYACAVCGLIFVSKAQLSKARKAGYDEALKIIAKAPRGEAHNLAVRALASLSPKSPKQEGTT